MISRTFITEYLKLFFPNYDERYLDLLEIISDFTDPYIEASNMAIIALDQNKRIRYGQSTGRHIIQYI